MFEKNGIMITDTKTSLIGERAAKPSIVSTRISLTIEIKVVTIPNHNSPNLIDITSAFSPSIESAESK